MLLCILLIEYAHNSHGYFVDNSLVIFSDINAEFLGPFYHHLHPSSGQPERYYR
jgi:hypothetical protein